MLLNNTLLFCADDGVPARSYGRRQWRNLLPCQRAVIAAAGGRSPRSIAASYLVHLAPPRTI